ncbi:NAD(P)/FAD-dependent oxidoreductase [Nocardioides taihuensis]|uniref:NAD(P)/FAD-dependent oxidoreductase n=1 Tax=Nocardioides taihuensis TaxID=1835606 RepID=A0ABW0BQS5_9ACTN
MSDPDFDAIVVGGRCAGAATAMLLARRGARVLVVDRARRGSDTLSTHALLRPGVVQLHRWGLLPALQATGTPAITTTTFHYGAESTRITLRPVHGTHALYAPRRTVLDPLLLAAAEEAGAEVLAGVAATGLVHDEHGRVRGVELNAAGQRRQVRAATTIGADGMRSLVADAVGAGPSPLGRSAGRCVYGYLDGVVTDGFEWFYGAGLTAGLIPTDAGQTLVFACAPVSAASATRLPSAWPPLLELLDRAWPAGAAMASAAATSGRLRRFRGAPAYRRPAYGPGWALVGDAGYYVDPMSSHGMSQALRDAELLAAALTSAEPTVGLSSYEASRDALSAPIAAAVEAIAAFDWDERTARSRVLAMTSAISDEVDALARLGEPWPGAVPAA